MIYLYGSAGTLSLGTSSFSTDGFLISKDGLAGWHSSPDVKVNLTERGQGNGALPVTSDQVLYAARTVTGAFAVSAANRNAVVSALTKLSSFQGELIRLRVVDEVDTFVSGYLSVSVDPSNLDTVSTGSFTLVAPDPRRQAWVAQSIQLVPTLLSDGGFSFGESDAGIVFPVSFGDIETTNQNTGYLTNNGSSPAYPVFEVNGYFDSVQIQIGSQTLAYSQPVVPGQPLILDFFTRSATVAGVDKSQFLTARGFVPVKPRGSIGYTLKSVGTGWVNATVRDTYI